MGPTQSYRVKFLVTGKVEKRVVAQWSQVLTLPIALSSPPQLQTFHIPSPCTSPQELSGGLAIAYVLNQM